MYTSWEVAAAIIQRLSGKEIHLTMAELDAVRGTVPIAEYHPGKIVYRIGKPEAWPEEPNGDMLNGFEAEAEKVFADTQHLGVGFMLNGKHVPYADVMRDPDGDIEVNGS